MKSTGIMDGHADLPPPEVEAHIILWAPSTHPLHLPWRPAARIIVLSPIC